MSRFDAAIAEQIWDMKYRLKDADGTAIDKSVEDTWSRICLLYTSPSPRDKRQSRMPSSA